MASLEHSFMKAILTLVLGSLLTSLIHFIISCRRPKNYPPGPPGMPILGNILDVPLAKPFFAFQSWAKKYGSVIGLKLGPMNLIILNDPQVVRELFEKRGMKYSDRPYNYIANEHIVPSEHGKTLHIIFMKRDDSWRKWRAAVRHLLGPAGCEKVLPVQGAVAARLVHDILVNQEQHLAHIKRWGLMTPLIAICGKRDVDDEMIRMFYETQHTWLDLLEPGKTPPVDFIPFLRWIPSLWAKWKRDAAFVRKNQRAFYQNLLDSARKQVLRQAFQSTDGTKAKYESLMAKIMREDSSGEWSDEKVAFLGGGLLDAAVDTTVSSLQTLLLAMMTHPEVQKKAQAEIDRVCGTDDPPQVEAVKSLPYLQACILETFRWRPATPMTLPHCLSEDDTFNGMFLPKGSTVIQNTWAFNHSEAYYKVPDAFNPDRYLLTPSGMRPEVIKENPDALSRPTWAFGVGRRACPGDQFGQQALLIAAAKLLWAFEVAPAGELVDTSMESGFISGLVIGPEPFRAKYLPRSKTRTLAISSDYEKSVELLDRVL